MSIYEYNEEKVMQALREEALEEGVERGIQRGIERGRAEGREEAEKRLIMKLFEKGKPAEEIAHMLDADVETIRELLAK